MITRKFEIVSVKFKSLVFNIEVPMLLILLRRVICSVENWGQWRRKWAIISISQLQLRKVFRVSSKLYLKLCPRQWLRPSPRLFIYLMRLRIRQLNRMLDDGLINCSKDFFKLVYTSRIPNVDILFVSFQGTRRKEKFLK